MTIQPLSQTEYIEEMYNAEEYAEMMEEYEEQLMFDTEQNIEILEEIEEEQTNDFKSIFSKPVHVDSKTINSLKTIGYENKVQFAQYLQERKKTFIIDDGKKHDFAMMSLDKIEIIYDELELFDPVFNISYWDSFKKEIVILENISRTELMNHFKFNNLFKTPSLIENYLSTVLFELNKRGRINISKKVFKTGYFLKDDLVIENTAIKDLEYTNEDVKKAIILLNELIKDRGIAKQHDATTYKFMLHAPFHWCIKTLSYANNNTRGLLNYGYPLTNKTTSALIGLWFYTSPVGYSCTAETLSALANQLEQSTFPSIVDDSFYLLRQKEIKQMLKKRGLPYSSQKYKQS